MDTDKEEMEGEDVADLVEISEVETLDQDKDEQEGDKHNMMVVTVLAEEDKVHLEEVGR
jgi:hypothetical protein